MAVEGETEVLGQKPKYIFCPPQIPRCSYQVRTLNPGGTAGGECQVATAGNNGSISSSKPLMFQQEGVARENNLLYHCEYFER